MQTDHRKKEKKKCWLQNGIYIIPFCLPKQTYIAFNMQRKWSGKTHRPTLVTSEKLDLGLERFGLFNIHVLLWSLKTNTIIRAITQMK